MEKKRQRHFIFTHNNYTPEDVENYKNFDHSYIIFGYETAPTTGTPHLQGYFYAKNAHTLSAIRKRFKGAHIEIPNGPPNSQRNYCSKDGNYYEAGTLPMSDIEKGEAGAAAWDDAFKHAVDGNFDLIPASMRVSHYKTWKQIHQDYYKPVIDTEIEELFQWQKDLLEIITKEPHKRQIHWRWSEGGGVGKSTFAVYLQQKYNATLLNNAKSADIAHALPLAPTLVVFDFSRTMDGHINWDIIEQIKNGNVFAPKYDSRNKLFKKPHVVVFANFEPNLAAFSLDRYDVIKLD